MRGLILAGGTGTRLHPVTLGISKQLVPVYDKPMIYYPLSTLMLAGIRDILVITTPHEADGFRAPARRRVARSASRITYAAATQPRRPGPGLHDRRRLHRRRAERPDPGRQPLLRARLRPAARAVRDIDGATVFAYRVSDASAPTASSSSTPTGRPSRWRRSRRSPRSNFAVPGLYFYDNDVVEIAREPQAVGARRVRDHRHQPALPRRRAGSRSRCSSAASPGWTPAPSTRSTTPATSSAPSSTGRASRSGHPEEVAWRQGFLTDDELRERAEPLLKSGYGEYLLGLLDDRAPLRRRLPSAPARGRSARCRGRAACRGPAPSTPAAAPAAGPLDGVGRADHLGRQAGRLDDPPGEPEPRRLPRRGRVPGAGRRVASTRRHDQLGDVDGPRGLADLVVDDADRAPLARPARAIVRGKQEPWAPYSQAVRTTRWCSGRGVRTAHSPAALVRPYADRGRQRRVLGVRRPRGAVEHVVGAHLDDPAPCRRAARASTPGADRVDPERLVLVGLGVVDRGPGGAVDHDVVAGDGLADRAGSSRSRSPRSTRVAAMPRRSRTRHRSVPSIPDAPVTSQPIAPPSCRRTHVHRPGSDPLACPGGGSRAVRPRRFGGHPGPARRRPRRVPRVVPRGRLHRGHRPRAPPRAGELLGLGAGTLRGIHFAECRPARPSTSPASQGAVLDVVVDLRVGLATFGSWDAVLLDDRDRRAIYLPEGLGHAFLALEDDTVVSYLCSAPLRARPRARHPPARPGDRHRLAHDRPRDGTPTPRCSPPRTTRPRRLAEVRELGLLPTYDEARA